jgi:hypothetical protein
MKAITLWQPWDSLWAYGIKQFETRSWATTYRGPIAIHAAKKDPVSIMRTLPIEEQRAILEALYKALNVTGGILKKLPLGKVIATAELVGCYGMYRDMFGDICIRTENGIYTPDKEEKDLGDWTPGRYAWEIKNIKLLPEPIPAKGMQRIWNWKGAENEKIHL